MQRSKQENDEKLTLCVFLNMGHPRPLFTLFSVFFKQTIQILQQTNVKNVFPVSGARIQTHDLLIMSILL